MAPLKFGFIPIEGGQFYNDALAEVVRAEALGFDSVWMEEHHSVKDHYWPLTRDVIIADSDAQARQLAERHIMISYRQEYAGGWKHPFIDSSVATELDSLMHERFIIGGPEECITQIKRFVDVYGMTHLICRLFFPGLPHAHIMRELELLAREVMPAFR